MNLTLTRGRANLYGVFGQIAGPDGTVIAVTLEHAFSSNSGFYAKVPRGTYSCVRGIHQLKNLNPFETFEVTGVAGHTGILFHKGNTNNDSEGCILLGSSFGTGCILDSKDAFEKFMEIQTGISSFKLTVMGL